MALALNKLRDNPDIDSNDIDDNWDSIEAAVNALQDAVALGAVTITSATTDENGLTFTLSNGATLGPLPFSGTPMRIMGDWTAGTSYKRGDIVKFPDGALIVSIDHVAADLEDDIAASKLALLVENGADGGGTGANIRSFQIPGAVANEERALGMYLCVEDCELVEASPIVAGLITPLGTGNTMYVDVRKVEPDGTQTTAGSIAIAPGDRRASLAIDLALAAGDILLLWQTTGFGLVGGADMTITAALQPPAA